jgi:hypothetical protein
MKFTDLFSKNGEQKSRFFHLGHVLISLHSPVYDLGTLTLLRNKFLVKGKAHSCA